MDESDSLADEATGSRSTSIADLEKRVQQRSREAMGALKSLLKEPKRKTHSVRKMTSFEQPSTSKPPSATSADDSGKRRQATFKGYLMEPVKDDQSDGYEYWQCHWAKECGGRARMPVGAAAALQQLEKHNHPPGERPWAETREMLFENYGSRVKCNGIQMKFLHVNREGTRIVWGCVNQHNGRPCAARAKSKVSDPTKLTMVKEHECTPVDKPAPSHKEKKLKVVTADALGPSNGQSTSKEPTKLRGKIWQFFDVKGKSVECNLPNCLAFYRFADGVKQELREHLRVFHPDEYAMIGGGGVSTDGEKKPKDTFFSGLKPVSEPPALIKKSSTSNAALQARQEKASTSKHDSKPGKVASSAQEKESKGCDPQNIRSMTVKMRPHQMNFWQQLEAKKYRKDVMKSIFGSGSSSSEEDSDEEQAVVAKKKAKLELVAEKAAEKKRKAEKDKVPKTHRDESNGVTTNGTTSKKPSAKAESLAPKTAEKKTVKDLIREQATKPADATRKNEVVQKTAKEVSMTSKAEERTAPQSATPIERHPANTVAATDSEPADRQEPVAMDAAETSAVMEGDGTVGESVKPEPMEALEAPLEVNEPVGTVEKTADEARADASESLVLLLPEDGEANVPPEDMDEAPAEEEAQNDVEESPWNRLCTEVFRWLDRCSIESMRLTDHRLQDFVDTRSDNFALHNISLARVWRDGSDYCIRVERVDDSDPVELRRPVTESEELFRWFFAMLGWSYTTRLTVEGVTLSEQFLSELAKAAPSIRVGRLEYKRVSSEPGSTTDLTPLFANFAHVDTVDFRSCSEFFQAATRLVIYRFLDAGFPTLYMPGNDGVQRCYVNDNALLRFLFDSRSLGRLRSLKVYGPLISDSFVRQVVQKHFAAECWDAVAITAYFPLAAQNTDGLEADRKNFKGGCYVLDFKDGPIRLQVIWNPPMKCMQVRRAVQADAGEAFFA